MAKKDDMLRRVEAGYSWDNDGSYVVYDSRNPGKPMGKRNSGDIESVEKAAHAINRLNSNSGVVKDSMGVWRSVPSNYRANTSAQAAVEGLHSLSKMKNGADVIVYDTEILGTTPFNNKSKANLDFYSPTEIGFQHAKLVNGQLKQTGRSISMLMRPDEKVYQRLNGLINQISNGGWVGMTDDVRRTLSDLTLYAGDPGQLFKVTNKSGRRIVSVNGQARDLHPLKGSVLSSSENIAAMRAGLENLMKFGTKPEDAVTEMNHFMRNMQDVRFAGYNVYNFDQPMMMDWLNQQIGKHSPDSKVAGTLKRLKDAMAVNQIDGLHAVRTLYNDTYSRYGQNVTLETMKGVFGMQGGQAHHALSDVNVTIEQINRLMSDSKVKKVLEDLDKKNRKAGSYNNLEIKKGDRLFAVNGISSGKAGQYDGVFLKKDGKLQPAYDIKVNPIYRNTTYQVEKFFDGVNIDGQKMWGVQLKNEQEDFVHTIFRNSPMELQNAIHGSLEYVSGANGKMQGKHTNAYLAQNEDRAMRRWRKMFSTESGGGMNLADRMYGALKITQDGEKEGLPEKEIKKRILEYKDLYGNQSNSDEFYRDFKMMRGRLEAEKGAMQSFFDEVNRSPIAGNSPYQIRAQSMALSEFGKKLDAEFGVNEAKRKLPNSGKAIVLERDGEKKFLNITDPDTVRGSLYGHLYDAGGQKPSIGTLRKRYRDMLMQLQAVNAFEAKKFQQYYEALDGVRHTDSFDNLLAELSNKLVEAKKTNSLNGALTHINVENPTQLVGFRKQTMEAVSQENLAATTTRLARESILGTKPFYTLNNGKMKKVPLVGGALEIMQEHDAAIQSLLARHGVSTNTYKSGQESLQNLVRAYQKKGLNVQLRMNEKNRGLQMVLATENVSEALLNGGIKDILKSPNTAVIDLAHINKDGTITRGAQNRVSRIAIGKSREGGYHFATGFDEIIGSLINGANTVESMLKDGKTDGKKGVMNDVHAFLNSRARKAMQNLSMNNRFVNPADKEDMFQVRSAAANWVRSGYVDVSALAEDWYREWYEGQSPALRDKLKLQNPDDIARAAREEYVPFVQKMGMQAERVFQRRVDKFAEEKLGMKLGMHSVKDTQVANYLRAGFDTRDLLAFGYYRPMARENTMKTVNYLALNKDDVYKNLKAQGFSDAEIERMTKLGVTTTQARKVLEGYQKDGSKISHLNVRSAYMNDEQLYGKLQEVAEKYKANAAEALKLEDMRAAGEKVDDVLVEGKTSAQWTELAKKAGNFQAVSTYDGMMVISEEVAQGFNTSREKKIQLSDGAVLTDEMKALLNKAAIANGHKGFDETLQYTFDNKVPVTGDKPRKGKRLTVSELVKEQVIFEDGALVDVQQTRKADPNGTIHKWNIDDYVIKGWNPEENALVLEERVKAANGIKFITTTGGRLTGTLLPQEIIEDVAGKGTRAIMPQMEVKKGMWGAELEKMIKLAVDEAKAQVYSNDKITSKDVGIKLALDKINEMFQETFGIADKSLSKVKDGEIVLHSKLGTDGYEIGRSEDGSSRRITLGTMAEFLEKVDAEYNTNFAHGDVIYGNIGIGKQDIYDWENGVGLVNENREGLLRYGRKELDMVKARVAQLPHEGKGSAVVGWLEGHLRKAAESQTDNLKQIGSGLLRTVIEGDNITPGAGDVVIRTTGRAFSPDDPTGRNTGRITENGVREISMHAINETPHFTAKDTLRVAEDYAGTIIDFGRADGKFSDGMTFQEAIKANGGTALLEIPDPDSALTKKYVRLIDYGDVTKGGTAETPVVQEAQKIQQKLWQNIQVYNSLGKDGTIDEERKQKIVGRIQELSTEYDATVAKLTSTAQDGGIIKNFASAKLDMSARFRVQGANPLATYEQTDSGWVERADAKYKEGTLYMSKGRFLEQIEGAEDSIAKILGVSHIETPEGQKVTVGTLSKTATGRAMLQDEIVKQMLDPDNGRGLYGLVNRYPTIKDSTIQSLAIAIDADMADTDRTARFAAGTAFNMKADNDGDFISSLLAHYKEQNAQAIHNELAQLQSIEAQAGRIQGAKTVAEVHSELNNTAKTMNVTVGKLITENPDMGTKVLENMLNDHDALETREARLGKGFVGIIDNTRDKTLTLATAVLDVLQTTEVNNKPLISHELALQYRKTIEDATAKFSQDLISSKKFNVAEEVQRLEKIHTDLTPEQLSTKANEIIDERHFKVQEMNNFLLNLTDENKAEFIKHNQEIGLFKVNDPKEMEQMRRSLDMIQDVQRWTAGVGGSQNKSLGIGVSRGVAHNIAQKTLSGEGDVLIPTQQNLALYEMASSHDMTKPHAETMSKSFTNFKNSVIQHYSYDQGGSPTLVESLANRVIDTSDHTLSGATMAEEASVKLREVAGKFAPKFSGGLGGGAVAFGAMWAASALIRSGPTPEGLAEQTQAPPPVAPEKLSTPTARITQNNGEYVNIRVSAKNAQNLSQEEIAALVHQEIGAMTSMKMDTTLNINDNTQNIDQQWLQGVVANAINKGVAF